MARDQYVQPRCSKDKSWGSNGAIAAFEDGASDEFVEAVDDEIGEVAERDWCLGSGADLQDELR